MDSDGDTTMETSHKVSFATNRKIDANGDTIMGGMDSYLPFTQQATAALLFHLHKSTKLLAELNPQIPSTAYEERESQVKAVLDNINAQILRYHDSGKSKQCRKASASADQESQVTPKKVDVREGRKPYRVEKRIDKRSEKTRLGMKAAEYYLHSSIDQRSVYVFDLSSGIRKVGRRESET
ncbi:unnamed protein product [Fusarium langsethiae]|nr:unnamed protein product [Fusarium langsethiae]